jgi:hypothetical protein
MFHPFESPFIDDSPEVAAARYRTWLCAQPAFMRWVCAELRGKTLLCAYTVQLCLSPLLLASFDHS